MTTQELDTKIASLTAAARLHDATHNEGGEGYNPYTVELEALKNQLSQELERTAPARKAAALAAEEAEWTVELTTTRRAAWNAWVRANAKGGKLAPAQVAIQIQAQGWSLEPLKRAIARHGL